ncbi:MAG: nuclear transport factor 2 family protein [Halioglobus sp.]
MSSIEKNLLTRNALIDSYNQYAQGLDTKDWPMVRDCFADEVLIDYGDLSAATGDAAVPRQADDWVRHLQSVINGFDITQHMITNHRCYISDTEVSCRAYLSSDHVIFSNREVPAIADDDVITVVGEYNNHYIEIGSDWKICKSELVVHWSHGNAELFVVAKERALEQLKSQK